MQAPPQGSYIFLKMDAFSCFLTNEVQNLKQVKEIFLSQVHADKIPRRQEV